MSTKRLPSTLLEASRYFADLDVATQFVAELRWPDGPECPVCGGKEHSYITTRRLWKCKNKECRRQFSVKQGSIFEDSPIPLDKWLVAIWCIANSKNGISSHELGRAIGLTQKSAWFVLHRIRLAMQTGSFDRLDGEVEVDETFVGGKTKNVHKTVKVRKGLDRAGTGGKAIVAGALQRGDDDGPSQVRAQIVSNTRHGTLQKYVHANVEPGSKLYTDAHGSYTSLQGEYEHGVVDHATHYVNGRIYTNSLENFWALLKRGIHGTYVQVDPEHLSRYIDERVFTFNLRKLTDLERFQTVLGRVAGKRLTYEQLTAH